MAQYKKRYLKYAEDPANPRADEVVTIRQLRIAWFIRKYNLKTGRDLAHDLRLRPYQVIELFEETWGDVPDILIFDEPSPDDLTQMIHLGMFAEGTKSIRKGGFLYADSQYPRENPYAKP